MISFVRIDDRMIHRQTVTRWALEYPCDGIIAVNDVAASNPVLKSAYKGACRPVEIPDRGHLPAKKGGHRSCKRSCHHKNSRKNLRLNIRPNSSCNTAIIHHIKRMENFFLVIRAFGFIFAA